MIKNTKMHTNITPVTHEPSYFCKNHPDIPSGYFLSESPQNKYCKNCALNMALCGRKIEKYFTEEQLNRKMIISSTTEELMNCIEESRVSHELSLKLENYLAEVTNPLDHKIRQIELAILQLTRIKEDLKQLIESRLTVQIQRCKTIKEESIQNAQNIKKIIDEIESNFSNLIQMDSRQLFQQKHVQWTQLVKTHRERIIDQIIVNEKIENIKIQCQQFIARYQQAIDLKVDQMQSRKRIQPEENKQNESRSACLNIQCDRLVEELKINLTANAQLKNRNKKNVTDRDQHNFKKKQAKKQTQSQWQEI